MPGCDAVSLRCTSEVSSQRLEQVAQGNWLGLLFHDEHVPFARICRDGRRYRCEPVAS